MLGGVKTVADEYIIPVFLNIRFVIFFFGDLNTCKILNPLRWLTFYYLSIYASFEISSLF